MIRSRTGYQQSRAPYSKRPPAFETLELRVLLSGAVPTTLPLVMPTLTAIAAAAPLASAQTPAIYTSAQIRAAYGFNLVNFTWAEGQVITGNGAGQTIAIVDAFNDPNIVNDLKVFDSTFGLSNNDAAGLFALTVHQMSSRIATNSGWALEIALDVEWAHAIAPGARILLVEARSSSFNDLLSAVDYARGAAGVVAVSMSWGGSEFLGEQSYDSHFTTPTGHIGGSGLAGGVTFVAASGDGGAPAIYPSTSPNVVAVGGTTLTLTASNQYSGEAGWSGSGGGVSPYETKPSYQSSVTLSASNRTAPDLAYNADPNSGYYVYDSVSYFGSTGWWAVGGTSAGSPQVAAMIAIADQGRALAGKGSLDGPTQTLPAIYSLASANFHDIVSGSNGYASGPGYDLVTGRGSPTANLVIADLVSASSGSFSNKTGTTTTSSTTGRSGRRAALTTTAGIRPGSAARVAIGQAELLKGSQVAAGLSGGDSGGAVDLLSLVKPYGRG